MVVEADDLTRSEHELSFLYDGFKGDCFLTLSKIFFLSLLSLAVDFSSSTGATFLLLLMLTIFRLLLFSIVSSLWRTLSDKIDEEDIPVVDEELPVVVDDDESDVDDDDFSFVLLLIVLLTFEREILVLE